MGEIIQLFFDRQSFFLGLLVEHLFLAGIAISIIVILGASLGILMTRMRGVGRIVMGLISFMYTIPSIALFGMLVTLTGIGNKSAIIALVIYGLLPMVRNVYVGITEVDDQVIEAAKGMGTTSLEMLFRIELPLALPIIFAGFRTMVVMTIALGAIASFIGAGGLGVAIYRGITTYYPAMIAVGSLLVALLAIVIDGILGIVEKRISKRVLGNVAN